ncbi:MAG: hypothetical protein QOJ89_960 [bacterium]
MDAHNDVEAERRSPAEEARTLVAKVTVGYLATVGPDGSPWASMVSFGPTVDGDPVLLLSTEAEDGRNLLADPRASLTIYDASAPGDALDRPRVTLSGGVARPEGERAEAALDAHTASVPAAPLYASWDEFEMFVVEVEQVRAIGGFFRVDAIESAEYRAAEPDPTAPVAANVAEHLNAKQAEGLLALARELAGARGAVAAVCTGLDRYGIDLSCTGAGQSAPARVLFDAPLGAPGELRPAVMALVARAQDAAE